MSSVCATHAARFVRAHIGAAAAADEDRSRGTEETGVLNAMHVDLDLDDGGAAGTAEGA